MTGKVPAPDNGVCASLLTPRGEFPPGPLKQHLKGNDHGRK